MSGAPTLTDGVVMLRGHRPDDAEGSYEQCQDPLSRQWTTVPIPYTREMAVHWVTETMPAGWADGSGWGFAVEVEGRYAGTVELRDEGAGRAELAFGSHPWVRGSGAMERAVRAAPGVGVHRAGRARGRLACQRRQLGLAQAGLAARLLLRRHRPARPPPAWASCSTAGSARCSTTDVRGPRRPWLEVPVLEAGGLRLRPWREADVPRIVEACRDERTQLWLGRMPNPYTEADARAWLEHQQENRAQGQALNWAVVDRDDDDRALASISAFDLVPEVEVEIGYWAHPDARGTGVTTRAMALVVRHAFERLRVRRVTAGAAVDNAASRRVIEANGLRAWGTERAGTAVLGGRADIVWYDVLVEEWRGSRRG